MELLVACPPATSNQEQATSDKLAFPTKNLHILFSAVVIDIQQHFDGESYGAGRFQSNR
jgi:hypothetical protein